MFGFRFSLAPLLALVMFAASAGVVWLAHIEAGEMTTVRQPPLVKASTAPLKRSPEDPGGREVADLGGVGDLLRDQPADAEERLLPKPEQPVTPADASGGESRSEANAALEALVSELRNGRPESGDAGLGGPNTEESISFPSPSRPAGADGEPETSRGVSAAAGEAPPATDSQAAETAIAGLSQTFEATTDGRYRVQLAAVRAEEDAKRAWTLFQEQLGPFIGGLQPFFERAETSNGVFYRVQVGPFGETAVADRLCVELKKQDVSCFVVSR
ncbi:MAG: SPOR domain-containing protein [Geminicoccaceae bacterium]